MRHIRVKVVRLMLGPLIPEGYILLSRKLLNSGIFNKPPLYIKVWIYLLSKAQHKEYKGLKRGQLRTSIPEIQEACSYYIGFRKEKPTKKQVYDILEWLRNPYEEDFKGPMIRTMKGTHGMVITIENYSFYQDTKNYERNDDRNDENSMNETTREQYKQECKRTDNNGNKDKADYQAVINKYNDICISFSRVIKLSEARKKTIKARLKDYTIDDFEEMFRKAEDSDFLKGINDRNWSANFDWMLKESSMVKILEGNYSKKGDANKTYGEGYGTGDCNSTDYYKQFITS